MGGIKAISAERHWRPEGQQAHCPASAGRHQSHLSRKALETHHVLERHTTGSSRHQSHLSRKALETSRRGSDSRTCHGRHQSHLSRKALETPSSLLGVLTLRFGHQSHLSRKALETVVGDDVDGVRGEGIKAISAERHWRQAHLEAADRRAGEASKPSQPKGIGDLAHV